MPIVFSSPLSSATANATFLDKTTADTMPNVLTLSEASSGGTITNTQQQINTNTKIIFGESAKSNGDQLTPNALSLSQEFRLIGDASAVTLNVLPFDSQPADGTVITLVGHDDTNTVTIPLNDSQFGCYINGDATLLRGYILQLVYNDELERYLELGRNF